MKNKRSAQNLTTKHFSRFGEFLVSFELSKHGWNVYNPVYDEYIDLIIHKHVCKDRQYFSSKNFGKWSEFNNTFDKLE